MTNTETRQATYIKSNGEARSPNHCCCGLVVNITHSECVSVALFVKHAQCMRQVHIFICGLSGSTVFCTLSHKGANFEKVTEHKMCVLIFITLTILKLGKDPALSSSYWPISLLDMIGKLFEKILLARMGVLCPLLYRKSDLSVRNRVLLYKQLICSMTNYTCPAWRSAAHTHVHRLQVLQSKYLRLATGAPWYVTGRYTRI